MAATVSNNELKARIRKLCLQLEIEVEEDKLTSMNNQQLMRAWNELNAELQRRQSSSETEQAQSLESPNPKIDPAAEFRFVMAPGKALLCKSGMKGPGAEVTEKDVTGGAKRLESLTRVGTLVKQAIKAKR